jgi:SAM-dependent methyltransferase
MTTREAVELLEGAIPLEPGAWADLGAGDGTFTRALVERLAPGSRIYAVDREPRAVAALERWAARHAPHVNVLVADLALPFELPGVQGGTLDGILLANTLHFIADANAVLARLAARVRTGGRVVLVEYDRRPASRWVPYPISAERWPALAATAGLETPRIVARRPSAYGGEMYVAVADRRALAP